MQIRRRIAVEARRPVVLLVLVAGVAVALDQITKALIRATIPPNGSIPVIEGVFHITHVRNTGAAFGLMPGQRVLFVLTSTVVLVAVAVYVWRARPREVWTNLALGLLAGGALGNLIDRVLLGRVVDFFDLVVIQYPVFNVADSCIVVGTSMLVAWILFGPEQGDRHPDDAVADSNSPDTSAEDGGA